METAPLTGKLEGPRQSFEVFKKRQDVISFSELAEFFAQLEPVALDEMIGNWKGGYFKSR